MKSLIREQLKKLRRERNWSTTHPLLPFLLAARLVRLAFRWLRARITFRNARRAGMLVFQTGRLRLRQAGRLELGNRVRFWSTITPTHLHVGPGGTLRIGDGCFVNGALIAAEREVSIGRDVYLAPYTQIADSYGFGTPEAALRTAPVTLEDNAWIATRAVILPGVTVGAGAVVGVGALVTEDVPPGAIVAGVPARLIRYLQDRETPATVTETKITHPQSSSS